MEQPPQIIPLLEEITRPNEGIRPDTTVQDVIDIFQKDSSLFALPVIEEGRFVGVINRKTLFFTHLGRPFAMDLYGKKPIRILMEESPLTMEPDRDITSALAKLLESDPALTIDSFPVVAGERCLGIIPVSDLMMRISENQETLLNTLNRLSARLREEVDKASKIQQALLPPAESSFGRITVSGVVRTSSEIGGDFYDCFTMGHDRLGLVVADVSGHGVQSGMVTTAAKASLHTLIEQGITTPAVLLHYMNKAILTTARQTLLMTCLVAVIDLEKEELTIANAGHNFPYVHRKQTGTLEMLKDVGGYPLGFEQDYHYQETATRFSPGDTLFLYSDGLVECNGRDGEEFGYGRLESFLYENITCSPSALKQLLLRTAAQFAGTETFEDDVTLLIAAFDPGNRSEQA